MKSDTRRQRLGIETLVKGETPECHFGFLGKGSIVAWFFFFRFRLGVALAFGLFLRDFAVHTRGREALQRSIFAVGASSAAMRRV
jgi:hypothetical protein